MLIANLVEEREQRQIWRAPGVHAQLGPEQTVLGPVLVIPYQAGERPRTYVRIAAAKLDLAATLNPQERRRGLFSATVYDAKLDMQGAFVVPAEARLREVVSDKDGRFIWNEAAIAFGTRSRLTGLSSSDNITVDGTPTAWVPCLEALRPEAACKGADMVLAKAPLPLASEGVRVTFKGRVTLRGTGQFAVIHAAKEMSAMFRSSWPSPSFAGDVLPLNSTISPDGFEAKWRTTEFGSPRITTASAVRAVDIELAVHRRRSHSGDAISPHDRSHGEVRPAVHRASFATSSSSRYCRGCASTSCNTAYSACRCHCSRCCCSRSPSRSAAPTAVSWPRASFRPIDALHSGDSAAVHAGVLFALMLAGLFELIYVLLELEPTRC